MKKNIQLEKLERNYKVKRSKYNLLPYFIDDERSLAKRRAYVASCEKFFNKIKKRASERASLTNNNMGLYKSKQRSEK